MYAFHSNQIRCTYFFATTLNLINSKILGNFTKLPRWSFFGKYLTQ